MLQLPRFLSGGLLLGLLLPPLPASAQSSSVEAPDVTGDRVECESVEGWASRYSGRTPSSRHRCVHRLASWSRDQELRVSHLRRALPGADPFAPGGEWFGGRTQARGRALSLAPPSEAESSVELKGSRRRWSYQTEFDLGRETRIDDGRLLPEGRSQLRLKSGLDFGLVRTRLDLVAAHRQDEVEVVEGFQSDPGSTSQAGGRAFVDLVLPRLPVLTLGAGREEKEVLRGRGAEPQRVDTDVQSAALWYGHAKWQAYAVSSRYSFRDEARPDPTDAVYYDHYVGASYWPAPTLTLNPSLRYSEASYDDRQTWTRTLSAHLGVYSTGLWENGLVTLWGGYTRNRDSGDTFDYEQMDLALGIEQTLAAIDLLEDYEIAVGSSLGYGHYIDRLHPDASGPGFRTLLTLRISAR